MSAASCTGTRSRDLGSALSQLSVRNRRHRAQRPGHTPPRGGAPPRGDGIVRRAGTFLSHSHQIPTLDQGEVETRCHSQEDVMKVQLVALALSAALSMPALAADQVEKAPPSGAYKKVSE